MGYHTLECIGMQYGRRNSFHPTFSAILNFAVTVGVNSSCVPSFSESVFPSLIWENMSLVMKIWLLNELEDPMLINRRTASSLHSLSVSSDDFFWGPCFKTMLSPVHLLDECFLSDLGCNRLHMLSSLAYTCSSYNGLQLCKPWSLLYFFCVLLHEASHRYFFPKPPLSSWRKSRDKTTVTTITSWFPFQIHCQHLIDVDTILGPQCWQKSF